MVQTFFQASLIYIVLVLPYADGLGVYLYQFRQGVHKPAPDGNGSADSHILIGELLTRQLRGTIDRSTILRYHIDGYTIAQDLVHKGFCLAAGGSVTDCDCLNLIVVSILLQLLHAIHHA